MNTNLTWREQLALDLENRNGALVVFESFMMIIVNILSAVGNVLFCVVIYKTPSLQNKTNMYITVLAMADTLKAFMVMPLTLGVLLQGKWLFGHTMCQVQGFFILLLSFGALQTMSLIALNRYFCVVRPSLYRKYFQRSYCIAMLVCIWLTSLAAAAAPLAAQIGSFIFAAGRSCCWIIIPEFTVNISYTAPVLFLFILLPFGVIITTYAKVFLTIRNHSQNITSHQTNDNTTISSREIKVTKQIFVLVVGFGLCWIPSIIIELLDSFLPGGTLSRGTYMTYIYLGYISSALNPILYGIMNRSFRVAFLNIFCFQKIYIHPTSIGGNEAQKATEQHELSRAR